MGHVRLSEHIDAPVDHVWDMNVSCDRLAEWNVNIVEVKDCPGRLDAVGAKATTIGRVMGRKVEGQTETLRVDKPQIFEERITATGGIVASVKTSFAAARGGTDVTVEVDYTFPAGFFGGIAEKLLGGSLERDTRHSMENFKELCEATAPARV
ncbi:MAG TPA: SRPBCC family protein [Candidatus Limnocylindrales bacterium]